MKCSRSLSWQSGEAMHAGGIETTKALWAVSNKRSSRARVKRRSAAAFDSVMTDGWNREIVEEVAHG